MKKKNIVLVGFRGSGKKEFGQALGKITGLPFADIDTEVEFLIDDSIEHFVDEHGWQVYREIEQKVAHDFCRNFSGVVSTGAGTIENSKNLENLKKTGVFIFANPDFSTVRKRLLSSEKEQNRDRLNPDIPLVQEIDQMWTQRKGIYQAISDIEIIYDLSADQSLEAQRILPQLKNVLPKAPKKKKIAVLGSTRGTTFQGLLDSQKKGRIPNIDIDLFISDKPDCGALEKAQKSKISNIKVIEEKKGEMRDEYDRKLINTLREHNPDLIILCGWMRIFSTLYCEQFGNITLNVHPSLLPKGAGLMNLAVHEKILEDEERYTGCTIHRVTPEVDMGENVLQRKILVDEEDSPESLQKKVQKQEILAFCEVLEKS